MIYIYPYTVISIEIKSLTPLPRERKESDIAAIVNKIPIVPKLRRIRSYVLR